MAAYRLYDVNGDGHIARAEWIEAESDERPLTSLFQEDIRIAVNCGID